MISLILFVISIVLCYFVFYVPHRPKNFPPGPRWLPMVGCAPQFRRLSRELGHQHLALSWLSRHYGSPVIGLKLGGQLAIAVTGHEAVKQVFTREEFQGRPDNFFIRLRSMGTRKGITCTDGNHWHEQRSFAVRHLKSLGFGKRTMETLIQEQVEHTVKNLENKVGVAMCPDFGPAVMSVLWALIAGTQFSDNDPLLNKLLSLMHRRAQAFDMSGGVLSQFPWLRFIAPDSSGYTLLKTVNQQLHAFFLETICDHRSSFCKDAEPRDLIDSYLKEMDTKNDTDSTFTEDQLVMVCLDMFVAGSTTTGNSLSFLLLYLSRYPDIQKLVQKELDENLGENQLPTLADQVRLPYLCAVILEVLRTCDVAPVTGPRRLLKDAEIMGYTIPKDTMVLMNSWSVHNDTEYWQDPENFRPERFISEDGTFKPDERVIPFGLGRRRCLGETLARGCLFSFVASLLQRFNIRSTENSPPPPPLPGITLSPPPFQVILENRHQH